MPGVARAVIAAAALALASARAGAEEELRATTPLVPGPGSVQRVSESPLDRRLALGGAALARMRQVLEQLVAQAEKARAERDIIELDCVNEKLTAVKGLLRISQRAGVALREAVARADDEGSEHELDQMAIAQRTSDELLAESEACVGELAAYSGDTAVEMAAEGLPDGDPTARTGEQPFLDRPPSASPYQ